MRYNHPSINSGYAFAIAILCICKAMKMLNILSIPPTTPFTFSKTTPPPNSLLRLRLPNPSFCTSLLHGIQAGYNSVLPKTNKGDNIPFSETSKKLLICYTIASTFLFAQPCLEPVYALQSGLSVADVSVLMSGDPIKDPEALLRYALPINNKPIRDIQKNIEKIADNLKLPGNKAFNSAKKNIEQAMLVLDKYESEILKDIPDQKKEAGKDLIIMMTKKLKDLETTASMEDKEKLSSMQKELLNIVNIVEEDMIAKFPFAVPQEYADKPLLKGRATVEMKVKRKSNPDVDSITFQMVIDGYNAPVTSGNFVDLVERHFYDGMTVQKAKELLGQTGDPEGPADGFVDPGTGKIRTIPLEIMVAGDNAPIYGSTLEECNRLKAQTKLPFTATGTIAMARKASDNNSASSQFFWLVDGVPFTSERYNTLNGQYSAFGYVIGNREHLSKLKDGDVIESMRVVSGAENLVNPTYKIRG